MGRTIPSFRIAAEIERRKWTQFRSALNKKERKIFDDMLSCNKLYNSACMIAARPIVLDAVLMSIIFHHYKHLKKLTGEIQGRDFFLPEKIPITKDNVTLDNWTHFISHAP